MQRLAIASAAAAAVGALLLWQRRTPRVPLLGSMPDAAWVQHVLWETIPLTRRMKIYVAEARAASGLSPSSQRRHLAVFLNSQP